ncbi:MAG: F0F1 ATP synthase subunit A [Nitrospirota bacterium]
MEAQLAPPSIITLLSQAFPESGVVHFLHAVEIPIFAGIAILALVMASRAASRNPQMVPSGIQNVAELIVDGLDQFVTGVMGPEGRKFVPFVGTLFVYILTMNLMGIVPGLHSPTSNINTTVALAVCVFFYVQYTGITSQGFFGYLHHLAGSPQPKGIGGYLIACLSVPFNLVLHVLGEFIKPLSLSVRLFGNVFGEDALVGQMLILGVMALSFMNSPVGLPLQFPFYLLIMLTSTIQAVVFSLLTVIYLFLMLPHHNTEEHH